MIRERERKQREKERHTETGTDTETGSDIYPNVCLSELQVIDELLFAIGGFNGVTTISHVECFDATADEW